MSYYRDMPLEDPESAPPREVTDGLRKVSDAQTLRALTHPVRLALIETLSIGGAMTATQAAERIGESPTTCSFHLRQLAKYGLVEEAGGGKGRSRPWRMTSTGMHIVTGDDPEVEVAANALVQIWRTRMLARYQTWLETQASYPREWRKAAGESEFIFYLTAPELRQLIDDVAKTLLPKMRERLEDPSKRPPGAIPVEMLMFSYPLELPPTATQNQAQPPDGGEDQ
jgi:DNA-binding transcriptional ArsR family regulator